MLVLSRAMQTNKIPFLQDNITVQSTWLYIVSLDM